MTTTEKLFVQIFDRKKRITEQVKQRTDLYRQRLASKILLDGYNPPHWLWNRNFNSESSVPLGVFFSFSDNSFYRYGDKLPAVDVFVCTADPTMEPPTMVISTVLSVMSYNYPPDKLSVYLSDDGGSGFTFYALLEASRFSKYWTPFCKKFSVEPRSPAAYFAQNSKPEDPKVAKECLAVKKLYEEMKSRIESAIEKGGISKDIRDQHKGFSEWNSEVTKQDHQSIVQILIDRRNLDAVDDDGHQLPTLVYVARENRPHFPHNFKAGSMNSLVSSLWFLPFAYVYAARNACSIAEALACGDTLKAWWNSQRMWNFRRMTSYLFAFINTITRQLGFSQSAFSITAKVVDDDALERYEEGTMEFGTSSVMFTIIATLALLNFFGFTVGILKIIWRYGFAEGLTVQIGLCLVVVVINLPVYQALFLRDNNGRIPSSVMFKSLVLASLACLIPVY
ncbi:hypothetical protein RHSIM_RhsimUnG0156400 [Rhododendron simsii]|uniref:Uncharacterized protein n=1 Tax=Rhododendron simsii TaxID=118357 RepID=A0A834FU43_RHOSS|nr:hypothetical protein RHSIM_RhsimUnG0156400 [Rhododendron simsii]